MAATDTAMWKKVLSRWTRSISPSEQSFLCLLQVYKQTPTNMYTHLQKTVCQ